MSHVILSWWVVVRFFKVS